MPPAEGPPPQAEPAPDLIALFVAPLNRVGLTYMVTGAVAAIVYGEPRLTNDIDLVVQLTAADVARFAAAFGQAAFYVPPVEVMVAEARRATAGQFNLIHVASALKADIYVAGTDPLHLWALPRRRPITVSGEQVWVAPPEYVILRKLEYLREGGSDKHARDIRAMLRELGDEIDVTPLLDKVRKHGLTPQWEAVRRGRD